jgi:hypothetical protein
MRQILARVVGKRAKLVEQQHQARHLRASQRVLDKVGECRRTGGLRRLGRLRQALGYLSGKMLVCHRSGRARQALKIDSADPHAGGELSAQAILQPEEQAGLAVLTPAV